MMAGDSTEPMEVAHYSRLTGLIYIFNLIVGTGALTLPAAFHDAGWFVFSLLRRSDQITNNLYYFYFCQGSVFLHHHPARLHVLPHSYVCHRVHGLGQRHDPLEETAETEEVWWQRQ